MNLLNLTHISFKIELLQQGRKISISLYVSRCFCF